MKPVNIADLCLFIFCVGVAGFTLDVKTVIGVVAAMTAFRLLTSDKRKDESVRGLEYFR